MVQSILRSCFIVVLNVYRKSIHNTNNIIYNQAGGKKIIQIYISENLMSYMHTTGCLVWLGNPLLSERNLVEVDTKSYELQEKISKISSLLENKEFSSNSYELPYRSCEMFICAKFKSLFASHTLLIIIIKF